MLMYVRKLSIQVVELRAKEFLGHVWETKTNKLMISK